MRVTVLHLHAVPERIFLLAVACTQVEASGSGYRILLSVLMAETVEEVFL